MATVGNENKHLRMVVAKGGKQMNCIGFYMGEYSKELRIGDVVSLAFQMDVNNFQGNYNVQLLLKDIKK